VLREPSKRAASAEKIFDVDRESALLRRLTQGAGGDVDKGWNFIVPQHTDCGILRMQGERQELAEFCGVGDQTLSTKIVADPRKVASESWCKSTGRFATSPSAYASGAANISIRLSTAKSPTRMDS
jgi:hypothetical protein